MKTYSMQDIAGYALNKTELERLCDILQNREAHEARGATLPKGLILYGPPGTGKTLFARVLADVCGLPFVAIALADAVDAADIRARIRTAFIEARERGVMTVVFLDELDKLLPEECYGGHKSDETRLTLTQLLTLIDGIGGAQDVFFVATCNRYSALPESLVRAGRMDKKMHLRLPDKESREAILALYMARTTCRFDLTARQIADMTQGFSGAALHTLVNECILAAGSGGRVDGMLLRRKIAEQRNEDVVEDAPPACSYTEAVHAVGHYLVAQTLHLSSGDLGTETEHTGNSYFLAVLCANADEADDDEDENENEEDADGSEDAQAALSSCFSREDYEQLATVLAAGYAAEQCLLGTVYDGNRADLNEMCNIGIRMAEHGMLGMAWYMGMDFLNTGEICAEFYRHMRVLMQAAVDRAEKIIRENTARAEHLIDHLTKRGFLPSEEALALWHAFDAQ